jgi:signal transduction histidine kinase
VVGGAVAPLLITHASEDPRFREHPGLHQYGIESYIAVPLFRRDGSPFGTLCALDPRPAPLSEANFAIFRLLADLIAFELEADEQQRRREQAIRAMEDFVAVAVHDLRQPLTALSGRAQLLARRAQRGASAEDLALAATQVASHARRAVALSDMLLDMARIETGTFVLTRASVNLVDIVSQVLEDMQITAPSHIFQLDGPASLMWDANETRLSQALRNLLENAAKYAPAERGPIELALRLDASDAAGETVLIRVRDHGIGVAAEELPRLFEHKYRTAEAIEQGISGAGLGLSITRKIVEAHGGRIWAARVSGGGLEVSLTLPRILP